MDPFDDPTTAVQAIDRLHDCLGMLAERPFSTGEFHDDDGELRLVAPAMTWAGYVRLAFHEVTLAGAGSPQVTRRLRAALDDLKVVAPPERQQPLDAQIKMLESAVRSAVDDEEEARIALVPDRQGIGSGEDMVARHSSSSSARRSRCHPSRRVADGRQIGHHLAGINGQLSRSLGARASQRWRNSRDARSASLPRISICSTPPRAGESPPTGTSSSGSAGCITVVRTAPPR